jgi:hypothetical protein
MSKHKILAVAVGLVGVFRCFSDSNRSCYIPANPPTTLEAPLLPDADASVTIPFLTFHAFIFY